MSLAKLLEERFKVRTRAVRNPKAVTAASTTAQLILNNNPDRLGLVIMNLGAQVCYVDLDNEVSGVDGSEIGIRLDANGGSWGCVWDEDFDMTAWAWWIISVTGTPRVFCLEIVEY